MRTSGEHRGDFGDFLRVLVGCTWGNSILLSHVSGLAVATLAAAAVLARTGLALFALGVFLSVFSVVGRHLVL